METTTVPLEALDGDERAWRWFRLPEVVRRLYRRRRTSERHLQTVWLVVITPPPAPGRTIGLITTTSWAKANSYYTGAVADVVDARSKASVKLCPYRTDLSGQALLDELLSFDDGLEGLPAAREFVPGHAWT